MYTFVFRDFFDSIFLHLSITIGCPLSMIILMMKTETFKDFSESAFNIAVTGASSKFASILLFLPMLSSLSKVSERLHQRAKTDEEVGVIR